LPRRERADRDPAGPNRQHDQELVPVPQGSVYGFNFPFGGTAQHPHPGIVIKSAIGMRNGIEKVGVIALAITHSEQDITWKDPKAVLIPDDEKIAMGLDGAQQWVCFFEQIVAFFPDDTKTIRSAKSPYLGRASEKFTRLILEAWNDFRKS
jgi:hypothetical protein